MNLVIDGVFFSLADSGIARVWRSVLPHLLSAPNLNITILDRGNAPRLSGLKRLPFPVYKDLYNPDDSILIQKACDYLKADVFTSTYHTTPLTTPMFLLIHDMIPELFNFDLKDRHWQEKAIAVSYARRFIAVSQSTKKDLAKFYPDIEPHIQVAHCGYDQRTFRRARSGEIADFKAKYKLNRPYMLLVGSRDQHLGYKNCNLFFRSLASVKPEFDIVCVGGEPKIHTESMALVPKGMSIQRVELEDAEMVAAYGGATALVYPSLYEGFGLPVVEAMACGCPVITTGYGSLSEVSGGAALEIDGHSVDQMRDALEVVQRPEQREKLVKAGLEQVSRFDWKVMSNAMIKLVGDLSALGKDSHYREFAKSWSMLRNAQAAVDTKTWQA